jgi:hypothetical protein
VTADRKRAAERAVFERFAATAEIRVVPGSLVQPDPPAPDIAADIEGAGRIAFELVRLDADDEFLSRRMFLEARELLDSEFQKLPEPQRTAIETKFSSSGIAVEFHRFADTAARRRALAMVWPLIEDLPASHDGEVDMCGRAIQDVESLWVIPEPERTSLYFRSFIVGSPMPVHAERLSEKLQRRYVCAEPLELLAYNEVEQLAHLADEQRIRDAVESQIAGSQFRRVWVFDGYLNRVAHRFDAS